MTCIIGLKHNDNLYMGSDSAITLGNGITAIATTKILRTDNCMVGISGARVILNWFADRDYLFEGKFNADHLNRIWDSLKQATPMGTEGEMIIAANKNLYWIGNIAGWRLVSENFECIGNGAQVAKGAMEMSANLIDNPQDRIFKSLQIAEQYCVGIKAPFRLEYIEYVEVSNENN